MNGGSFIIALFSAIKKKWPHMCKVKCEGRLNDGIENYKLNKLNFPYNRVSITTIVKQ